MSSWIILTLCIPAIYSIVIHGKQTDGKGETISWTFRKDRHKLIALTHSPLVQRTDFIKANSDVKSLSTVTPHVEHYQTFPSDSSGEGKGNMTNDVTGTIIPTLHERDLQNLSNGSSLKSPVERDVPGAEGDHYKDTSPKSDIASESAPTSYNPALDDCVYDVFESAGEIVYPNAIDIPRSSSSELVVCKWRIRVPVGPNIKLSFKTLRLELGSEYLQLAVGMGGDKHTRRVSGTKLPADLVVDGAELWMTIKSHGRGGFTQVSVIFFETVQDPEFPYRGNSSCGGTKTELLGNITSPGYPDHDYNNNEECTWFISGPPNAVVRVGVVDFTTEVYDQLRIGVGLLAKAPSTRLLTLFGQLESEREAIIPANSLWINFYADDTISDKGFLIQYEIILREVCDPTGVLREKEGEITSVNYPIVYPINSECTWFIRGSPESWVNVTLYDLDIQDGRDFLLIGEGSEVFSGPFTTYTGNISDVVSDTVRARDVWVHFTSDHMNGEQFRGFRLTYSVWEGMEPDWQTTTVSRDVDNKDNILTLRLADVGEDQFDNYKDAFRSKLATMLSVLCSLKLSCNGLNKLRSEDVAVAWRREEQGGRLAVGVRLSARVQSEHAMDAVDYDELEKLFHTDLQTLDLQHEPDEAGVGESSGLPEWLIGVIVVVILLIGVFFAMVVYSLIKERRKTRAGSYGANQSSTSMCEETEVGKDDGNIRITSFIVDNEKGSGNGWIDTEAATLQRRPQSSIHGCANPAFVEEEENNAKTQDKPESKPKEKDGQAAAESANSGECNRAGGGSGDQDKLHDREDNKQSHSTEGAVKIDDPTPSTSGTDDSNKNNDDNECSHSSNSSTDSNHTDKDSHSDLSTNL